MAPNPGPRLELIAVDTNVLIDMADGQKETLRAIKSCAALKNHRVIVTPRVVKELVYGAECWEDPRCKLARIALHSLLDWHITPETVVPLDNGICEIFANDMCRTLLPASERNDAIVLLEAAVLKAVLLVTWDSHLCDISTETLRKFLVDHHVYGTTVCTPAQVNRHAR